MIENTPNISTLDKSDNYLNFYNFSIWIGNQPPLQLFDNMMQLYNAYQSHFKIYNNAVIPLIVLNETAMERLHNNSFAKGFITLIKKEDLTPVEIQANPFIADILEKSTMKHHISFVVKIEANRTFKTSYIPLICFNFQQDLVNEYYRTLIDSFPQFKYQKPNISLFPLKSIDSLLQKHQYVAASDILRLFMLVILKNAIYCDITKVQPAINLTPEMIEKSTKLAGVGITNGRGSQENQCIFSNDVRLSLRVLLDTSYPSLFNECLDKNNQNEFPAPCYEKQNLPQLNDELIQSQLMLQNVHNLLMNAIVKQMSSAETFKHLACDSSIDLNDPAILNEWDDFYKCIDLTFERYAKSIHKHYNPNLTEALIANGFFSWNNLFGLKGSTGWLGLSFLRDLRYLGKKIYQFNLEETTSQDLMYLSVKNMLIKMQQSLGIVNLNITDLEFLAEYAYKIYNKLEVNAADNDKLSKICKYIDIILKGKEECSQAINLEVDNLGSDPSASRKSDQLLLKYKM